MKRSISFILAAALLLSVMGGIHGEAFAAAEVDEVCVEGLPESIAPGAAEVPELGIREETATISEISWVDKDKTAVAAFQEGKLYYLQIILDAVAGCEFADYLSVWGWWDDAEVEVISKTKAKAWFRYSLEPGVGDIALTVTGLEVGAPVSGVQVTLQPDAKVEFKRIDVYDRFLDEDATGNFQDGRKYYIRYTLTPKEGYTGEDVGTITINGEEVGAYSFSYDCVEVEQMFSTCEPLGTIELISSGLEEGAPASGVTLQISENAHVTLKYIEVKDWDAWEPVEGNFVHGKTYSIEYCLQIEDGYGIDDDTEIFLNGEAAEWGDEEPYIYVYEDFTTCDIIDTVVLTMPEPEIGRKIVDTWPVCVGNTYEIREEFSGWCDLDGEEIPDDGVFQKGHAYNLSVNMVPAEGYVFSENLEIRINDKVLYEYSPGHEVWPDLEYSFREKITVVELPAFPQELQKGDALQPVQLPANVNYTMECAWNWFAPDCAITQETEENVTKVTKDGFYVLCLEIQAKPGCEFTQETVATAGGQLYQNGRLELFRGVMVLYKIYALGMESIDRIDISVAEPQVGRTPTMPTVSSEEVYQLPEDCVWWYSGQDGKTYSLMEGDETFRAGDYAALEIDLVGLSGYAFSEELEIYVNGQKVEPLWVFHMGFYDRIVIGFGKLRQTGSEGPGDFDGLMGVDEDDAIYLLQHVLMPEMFPVTQNPDLDGNGVVNEDDAIYLLQHVLMPDMFPLS